MRAISSIIKLEGKNLQGHLKYASYVFRHKRHVFLAGRLLGLGVIQMAIHDWQKLTLTEWFPYVEAFYGDKASPRRKDGSYDPTQVSVAFDRAWHHHLKYGRHHSEHWLLPLQNGGVEALEMPEKYIREMVADWYGAGMAQDKPDFVGWFQGQRPRLRLHPRSLERAEQLVQELRRRLDASRS